MKNRFFGKYYKFISDDGYVFACIDSVANEGKMLQIITPDKAFFVEDTDAFRATDDGADFAVETEGLTVSGHLDFGPLHPPKGLVMGPFTFLPMECRHAIYSMFHTLRGTLVINGEERHFTGSPGYIEGDSGKNFPKKYLWYNSVSEACSVTMAVATIPLGPVRFIGVLCFVRTPDQEYRLCTYNGAKALEVSPEKVVIRKGKKRLTLTMDSGEGYRLKAPVEGNMDRYIKESVTIPTRYVLCEKDEILAQGDDPVSSLEYMWD